MAIIDEEGRIFGTVNVIDALVVLFVLAVVVAGAAFVLSDDPVEEPDLETTYATLDLGTQPEYVASNINEGDSYSPADDSSLTITDLHLAPDGGETRVIARVELTGEASGDRPEYAGAPPRLGRSLEVQTDRYAVSGSIRHVSDDPELDGDAVPVVVRATLSASEARNIAPGDEIRHAGRTVATVEDRAAYAGSNPSERDVFLALDVDSYLEGDDRRLGRTPLREGQRLTLPGDGYTIDGQLERVGGDLERTSADVVVSDTVDAETAERIATGDASRVAGDTVGAVESVSIYGTSNPDRKRVVAGLSLTAVGYGEQPRFGAAHVQRGTDLTFETDDYRLTGPIERVGALEERGTPTQRTVTLTMTEIDAAVADSIRAGMTERAGGETVATVTAVEDEPSEIVVTTDDGDVRVVEHPRDRDVTITAELSVRETADGVRFKGESIRIGQDVTLDLGEITVEPTVVRIER